MGFILCKVTELKNMNGQFTQIQTRILLDKRLTPRDITVLLFLQARAGTNGYCWWSYSKISEQLGISRMTAIRAIKKLVSLNYVVKEAGFVEKEKEIDGKKTHEITDEQSANTYYINNNPDAGVVTTVLPQKRYKQYQECYPGVVTNLDSEIYKGFEKNARACACTRENKNCTSNEQIKQKTESGNLPGQMPDDNHQINCPFSYDEIRRLHEFRENFKNAFKKDISMFAKIFKISSGGLLIFVRFFGFVDDDTKLNIIEEMKKTVNNYVTNVPNNTHFENEMDFLDYDN